MMSARNSPANTRLPEFHQFPAAESAKAPVSAGETHFGLTPQPATASPTVKKAAAASPRSNAPARFSGIWSDGLRILDFDSTKDGWHPIYNVVNTRYAPRKGELVGHFQIDNGSVIRTRPLHSKNQKSGIVGLSRTAMEMTIKSGGGIATLVRID